MQGGRPADNSDRLFEDIHVVKLPARRFGYRGNAGDIEPLEDGRLLLSYTCNYDSPGDSAIVGDIMGQISDDQGRSWGEPFLLGRAPEAASRRRAYWHPQFSTTDERAVAHVLHLLCRVGAAVRAHLLPALDG